MRVLYQTVAIEWGEPAMPKRIPKDPNLVFRVAQLFFEKNKASAIADQINRESKPQPPLTRESVYPLLAEARDMGFVKFVPPVMETLGQEIARRIDCRAQDIRVVFTADEASNYLVAESAAEL